MKILLITNKCPPDSDGGLEMSAFQMANALRKRGHELDVVTSHLRPGFVLNEPEPDWVHRIFEYVPISSKAGVARKIDAAALRVKCTTVASRNVPAMESFLKGRNYDVAYCFGLHRISLATAFPLTERKIPILWHAGGTYIVDQLVHWPATIPGFTLSMNMFAKSWYEMEKKVDYSHIAFVSAFLRDSFKELGMTVEKSYVIPRGVDCELVTDLDRPRANPSVFFSASRLDREKGIDTAINAAGILHGKRPDLVWKLEIAGSFGDPGYRSELETLIAAAQLEKRVVFLGKLSHNDVLKKMRDATAFINSSRFGEPFGRTNIEALASATPVIASETGAVEEIVVPGESALLYGKEDPAQLATHMERILVDADLRKTLASNGLKVVTERFTLDRIVELTESTLADVLKTGYAKAGAA